MHDRWCCVRSNYSCQAVRLYSFRYDARYCRALPPWGPIVVIVLVVVVVVIVAVVVVVVVVVIAVVVAVVYIPAEF